LGFKITILSENTVDGRIGLLAEHGFSVFIEGNGENILFDTGQGLAVMNNALVLNKDLRSVHKVVLSHGHKDHSGGLAGVLQLRGSVEVLAHPHIFLERYKMSQSKKEYVGLPFGRAFLEGLGARFLFVKDFQKISEHISVTGEVPRRNSFEKGDADLYAGIDGKLVPDPFSDDLSLVLDTREGLIVILGCAHSGLVNILDHILEKTGEKKIRGIIGGTHLKAAREEQLLWTLKELERYEIDHFYVSHCTGLRASMMLARRFGKNFIPCHVGTVLELS
jgi:7,8-dihydropterin-6-yl-methyl-4-(beta-D-ribofuranosyl)aminobenzene 5'-phosphate synthase